MYLALQSCVCGCKLILEIEKKIEALRLWIFSDFLCPPFFPQGGGAKEEGTLFLRGHDSIREVFNILMYTFFGNRQGSAIQKIKVGKVFHVFFLFFLRKLPTTHLLSVKIKRICGSVMTTVHILKSKSSQILWAFWAPKGP